MSSNDRERKPVTCQPLETQVAAAENRWERECQSFGSVLNQETTKSFPQTVEKEDCNSGL